MKTVTLSVLLFLFSWSVGAQCSTPTITASGPTTFCPGGNVTLSAPAGNVWVQKANMGGGGRSSAVAFSIGSKGYIGTGTTGGTRKKDFWEYDPTTDAWTQKTDFGGNARYGAVGFSAGGKGYIGTGFGDDNGIKKDFWEYDPAGNIWTRKADLPGQERWNAVGFGIGSKGYIGTGSIYTSGTFAKDFWEYNPATNTWLQKADFPQTRTSAVGFAIGSKGYIGTGAAAAFDPKKDLWEYDPTTNFWTQKASLPGLERSGAVGFSIGNKGYVGTGSLTTNNLSNDFYEYDAATNTWVQKANFGGGITYAACGFGIGSKGYLGAGSSASGSFYEYTPTQTYSWSPGGQTTQSISATATGNYTVTATSTTGCNATSAVTVVTVNAQATPVITASGTTICNGGSVTLTASATTAYQWYLNGNILPGATAQSYTANSIGNFTVTVTNATGCSATSAATTITAGSIATPTITAAGPTTFCTGGSVTLTSSSASSYQWYRNGNSILGATAQSYTATVGGNYTVIATNALGCSATSAATTVTVNTATTPVITASGATTFCPGGSVTLSASSAAAYQWYSGGNPISGATAQSYTANTSGSYSVTITNATGCSATSAPTVVTIAIPATPVITAAGPTSFCSGGSVALSSSTASTYQWYRDGNLISAATAQSYAASSSGNYTVTTTNATGCAATSAATTVTINPIVTANITPMSSTTLCPGSSLLLVADSADTWTAKANFSGGNRISAVAFSIGSKGYIGTGYDGISYKKDFWEFDPATNAWTQKADFGGTARNSAIGLSIGSKGYIGTGYDGTLRKDFWEYDPTSNSWTQKTDFSGAARINAASFAISAKGYISTGGLANGATANDLWEFDPATNAWTQKAAFGGVARYGAVGFSIANYGYIGTGINSGSFQQKDFWQYNPATNTWIQKADFSGGERFSATGFGIGNNGFIATGTAGAADKKDVWEFNPSNNTWLRRADFGGTGRSGALSFVINGKAYLGTGYDNSIRNDLWEYNPGYTYSWMPGNQTTASINVNTSGNYSVVTTNVYGCTATSFPIVISQSTIATPVISASGSTTLCSGGSVTLSAPAANVWTQKADFGGAARYTAVGFSIGSKGYVGTGQNGNTSYKDFWEYDPASDAWTQKADFGGGERSSAVGFSIGSKGYVGTGYYGAYKKDFWEYDPASNTWTQKSDFGGLGRNSAAGFSIGTKGYVGLGSQGNSFYKDFWAYDPVSNSWQQRADFGGSARLGVAAFSIGSKGYVGTGLDDANIYNDFWEYNPVTNQWVQKADFGGSVRYIASGFSIGSKGYIGLGYGGGSKNDVWEYDTVTDSWIQKADFSGAARSTAIAFSIGSTGYIGTGQLDNNSAAKDFYVYTPTYLYLWNPGGQTTPSVTVNTSGNYTVTTTNANGCSATSAPLQVQAFPSATVYVDASVASSGNGTSWATAYKEVREALYAAGQCNSITTINVAKGTYKPISNANRDSAFIITRGGLKIYGGYPTGGGTRNIVANPTILSGDVGTPAITDNSYHVMIIVGLSSTADSVVVDGFTITSGSATGTGSAIYNGVSLDRNHAAAIDAEQNMSGKIAFRNLVIANNAGSDGWGSSVASNTSDAVFDKCVFYGNSSSGTGQGGAIWNNNSTTTMTNCLLYNNYGAGLGGAIQLNGSNPLSIINSTLYANRSGYNGGAIRTGAGTVLNISNTIFYKNDVGTQNGTYVAPGNDLSIAGDLAITNSMMQNAAGAYGAQVSNSLFGINPLFFNEPSIAGTDNILGTADDGLHLMTGSPAINMGSNAASTGIATDVTGAARIQDGTVDMGAYEGATCPTSNTIYVDSSIVSGGNGSSWTTAFKELRDAVKVANQCGNIHSILVAKGTYLPTADTRRDVAFTFVNKGLQLYGGYPSGGGVRNTHTNPTILSGDIGTAADNSDNSYHIVVIANLPASADSMVLDGFTLRDGNANNGGFSQQYGNSIIVANEGGGIATQGNSNTLMFRNCIIANNYADYFGGGIYNNQSSPTILNCFFNANTASVVGGSHIYNFSHVSSKIVNCVFVNNGGYDAIYNHTSEPSIINCTIDANNTGISHRYSDGSTTITNCIITASTAINAFQGAAPIVSYSLVQGGYAGVGNINADPMFVNSANPTGVDNFFGTADDGLQLQSNSPAGNTGNNVAIPAGITTDITGAARIQSYIVDMGAYENGAIILPLTLLQFNGKLANTTDALLSWQTANEVNVSHFELQRSVDGTSFSPVTQVRAKGTNATTTDYSHTDKGLQWGTYYFRLRMVDKDGKETYSPIVTIQVKTAAPITLYPVPAKDIIWMKGGAENQIGSIALITDAQGKILQQIRITQWPQKVELGTLPAGTYFILPKGEKAISFVKH